MSELKEVLLLIDARGIVMKVFRPPERVAEPLYILLIGERTLDVGTERVRMQLQSAIEHTVTGDPGFPCCDKYEETSGSRKHLRPVRGGRIEERS